MTRAIKLTFWIGLLAMIVLAGMGVYDAWLRRTLEQRDLNTINSIAIEPLPVSLLPEPLAKSGDWVYFTGDLPQDAFALVSVVLLFPEGAYSVRYFTFTGHDIESRTAFMVLNQRLGEVRGHAHIQIKVAYHGHERYLGEVPIITAED